MTVRSLDYRLQILFGTLLLIYIHSTVSVFFIPFFCPSPTFLVIFDSIVTFLNTLSCLTTVKNFKLHQVGAAAQENFSSKTV